MPVQTKILIADHDPVSQTLLHGLLSSWGFEVVVAADGADAWDYLQSDNGPRLAILDAKIGGVDAVEICRRVRAGDGLHYVYLLLMTDRGPINGLVALLDAGADDYLVRPFHPQELRARVQVGSRIVRLQERLVEVHEKLYEQATRDSLTGLWNRTAATQILDREIARAARAQSSIAVIMADLDRFKQINDAHGHMAGDTVLREAARRMSGILRKYDSIGRYGGEEFLIVVPSCQFHDSLSVVDRLREAVCNHPFPIFGGACEVTCSFGVAWSACQGPIDASRMLREADAALYQAKRGGRNRVEVFGAEVSGPVEVTHASS